jgi:hypothetical protein
MLLTCRQFKIIKSPVELAIKHAMPASVAHYHDYNSYMWVKKLPHGGVWITDKLEISPPFKKCPNPKCFFTFVTSETLDYHVKTGHRDGSVEGPLYHWKTERRREGITGKI